MAADDAKGIGSGRRGGGGNRICCRRKTSCRAAVVHLIQYSLIFVVSITCVCDRYASASLSLQDSTTAKATIAAAAAAVGNGGGNDSNNDKEVDGDRSSPLLPLVAVDRNTHLTSASTTPPSSSEFYFRSTASSAPPFMPFLRSSTTNNLIHENVNDVVTQIVVPFRQPEIDDLHGRDFVIVNQDNGRGNLLDSNNSSKINGKYTDEVKTDEFSTDNRTTIEQTTNQSPLLTGNVPSAINSAVLSTAEYAIGTDVQKETLQVHSIETSTDTFDKWEAGGLDKTLKSTASDFHPNEMSLKRFGHDRSYGLDTVDHVDTHREGNSVQNPAAAVIDAAMSPYPENEFLEQFVVETTSCLPSNQSTTVDCQSAMSDDARNSTATSWSEWLGLTEPLSSILTGITLGVICLATVVGNSLVLAAIFGSGQLSGTTTTHYFVASLAVADLLLGTAVLPFSAALETTGRWSFGFALCDIWAAVDVLCCTASILSLCAISLDRYIGVTRPLRHSTIVSERRAAFVVVGVWLLSVAISVAPLFGWKEPRQPDADPAVCEVTKQTGYVLFSVSGSFYIPLAVILVVYYRVYREAARQSRFLATGVKTGGADRLAASGSSSSTASATPGSGVITLRIHKGRLPSADVGSLSASAIPGSRRESTSASNLVSSNHIRVSLAGKIAKFKREKKAAKTLGIVVGVFVLCWFPFFFILPLEALCPTCYVPPTLFKVMFWLGYCNSMMNPIIYTCASRDFKHAFLRILRCSGRRHSTSTSSTVCYRCLCCCCCCRRYSADRRSSVIVIGGERGGGGGGGAMTPRRGKRRTPRQSLPPSQTLSSSSTSASVTSLSARRRMASGLTSSGLSAPFRVADDRSPSGSSAVANSALGGCENGRPAGCLTMQSLDGSWCSIATASAHLDDSQDGATTGGRRNVAGGLSSLSARPITSGIGKIASTSESAGKIGRFSSSVISSSGRNDNHAGYWRTLTGSSRRGNDVDPASSSQQSCSYSIAESPVAAIRTLPQRQQQQQQIHLQCCQHKIVTSSSIGDISADTVK